MSTDRGKLGQSQPIPGQPPPPRYDVIATTQPWRCILIRTLVAALLFVGLLSKLHGYLPAVLLVYTVLTAAAAWVAWPVVRAGGRALRRLRHRHRQPAGNETPTAQVLSLTQINHYHYGPMQPAIAPTPAPTRRTLAALPQRGRQQRVHDSIFDIFGDDGPHR